MFNQQQTGKLTILYSTPRTGKTAAILDRIKEDAAAGRRVCVIIPDQFTFEYEKMLCCHMGAALYNSGIVDVLSFSRLTRTIFRQTGFPKGRAADNAAKIAVLRTVINRLASEKNDDPDSELLYFKKYAKRSSFANTVMTMLNELIHSGVTVDILSEISAKAALMPDNKAIADKLHDLLLIYTAYLNRLSELSLRDSMEDTRLAAQAAAQKGIFTGTHVYIDEFKSFTGDQYEMIRTVFSDCALMTVCMTTNRIDSSPHGFFSAVNETCRNLMKMAAEYDSSLSTDEIPTDDTARKGVYNSPVLTHLSKALILNKNTVYPGDCNAIKIVSADDIYGECDYICAEIKRLISEDNKLRYSDIAVLSRQMNDDICTLSAHFDRYGIPYYSSRKLSAKHHPLLLAISTVISLAAADSISSDMLFTYAKTGLSPLNDVETAILENFAFRWSVDADTWEKQFDSETSPKDKKAEELRKKLLAPLFELRNKLRGSLSGTDMCSAVKSFIEETKMENMLCSARFRTDVTDAASQMLEKENERIFEETQTMLDSIAQALPDPVSITEFRDIFTAAAEGIKLSSPPMSLDAVSAQQSDISRLSDPKIVFVMHANEGIFPDTQCTSETFSDKEREFFRNASHELSGSMKKRLAEERVNAYKALCAPSDKLYVVYSKNDISGKKLSISPLAERIREIFPKISMEDAQKYSMLYFCRTEQSAFAACIRNSARGGDELTAVRNELEKEPAYKKKFEYIDSLKTRLTASQKVDTAIVSPLMGGNDLCLSQTSFEKYVKCPFMYFMSNGLRVNEPQKQELSSSEWGNAVHECFRSILEKYSSDIKKFAEIDPQELSAEVNSSIDKYLEEAFHNNFSAAPDFDFFADIVKKTTLRSMLHLKEELKYSKFIPVGFEIPMGDPEYDFSAPSDKAIVFDCGNGHRINFTGKCDRADLWENDNGEKFLRIVDYKTGSKRHKLDMSQIENGINLQMLLYYAGLKASDDLRFKDSKFGGALYSQISAPEIIKNRYASEKQILENIDNTLKLEGIISDSEEVLKAMSDVPAGENRGFIDAKTKLSDNEVQQTLDKAESLMKEMCSSVYNGEFAANPLKINGSKSEMPCAYCSYKAICSSFPELPTREWKKA